MSALSVLVDNIPTELRAVPAWVGWRYETRGDRPTKVPLNARTGAGASSTNPTTWSAFDRAVAFAARPDVDGIGFVLHADAPFVGVDLDHCFMPNGAITLAARLILGELLSYSERSPSGTGCRVICRGTLPPGRRKRPDFEMYDSARFLTMTGHALPHLPRAVEECTDALARVHARLFPAAPEAPRSGPPLGPLPVLSDTEILQRAGRAGNAAKFTALYHGDTGPYAGDDSSADLALCALLGFWTADTAQVDRLFRGSGLMRPKWERADYRARTLQVALGGQRDHYRGAA